MEFLDEIYHGIKRRHKTIMFMIPFYSTPTTFTIYFLLGLRRVSGLTRLLIYSNISRQGQVNVVSVIKWEITVWDVIGLEPNTRAWGARFFWHSASPQALLSFTLHFFLPGINESPGNWVLSPRSGRNAPSKEASISAIAHAGIHKVIIWGFGLARQRLAQ